MMNSFLIILNRYLNELETMDTVASVISNWILRQTKETPQKPWIPA